METLQSFVLGAWHTGTGDPRVLVNPSNEEPLAEARSGGIDFDAVLRYAREKGGPALRAMSFQERGAMLKALSKAIHEHRDALLDLSIECAGTTRSDAKFDVDGAIGTLASYAYFAKSTPERGFLSDGEGVQLGRTTRFWGQHIQVPKRGAAVHINAFNFPAWNMCEKMACALLAGMPVIEKPGTPTAMLAWKLSKVMVESGVLPEGTFQFICGSTGDLLDRMGPQDVLAFTGSSATGALLRGNANLVANNVHVNIEADSLNVAILGPDVEVGSDAYDLALGNVELDMIQKTGQKCTAVRRILVPEALVEDFTKDLAASLERIQVGDPASRENRMGPLANKTQFDDVRAGIGKLSSAADVVCGGDTAVHDKGFFLAPTLLRAKDAHADVFHEFEVFGPVATVLPYSGKAEEAAELANRGGGGLVASVYSNDRKWTESVVLEISPWHGRVWVGSDKVADQAVPPGTVLPASVHGGPGRAGGGQELGGLRGLEPYLQRTAVQGFQGLVASAFGESD